MSQQHSSSSTDPLEASGYRTVRRMAEGGGGVIYEAEHIALGKRVAVKVLRREAAGASMEERMRVEAQVLARLRSPHLVEVSDFGRTSDGRPFYVMELLQGASRCSAPRCPRPRARPPRSRPSRSSRRWRTW
jgi:serine/threonine protein kinase